MGEALNKPFAIQYMEPIPQVDLEEVTGQYNDKLQVWQHNEDALSTAFPVTSFPNVELPGTTCTIPTRITPTTTKADTAVDD